LREDPSKVVGAYDILRHTGADLRFTYEEDHVPEAFRGDPEPDGESFHMGLVLIERVREAALELVEALGPFAVPFPAENPALVVPRVDNEDAVGTGHDVMDADATGAIGAREIEIVEDAVSRRIEFRQKLGHDMFAGFALGAEDADPGEDTGHEDDDRGQDEEGEHSGHICTVPETGSRGYYAIAGGDGSPFALPRVPIPCNIHAMLRPLVILLLAALPAGAQDNSVARILKDGVKQAAASLSSLPREEQEEVGKVGMTALGRSVSFRSDGTASAIGRGTGRDLHIEWKNLRVNRITKSALTAADGENGITGRYVVSLSCDASRHWDKDANAWGPWRNAGYILFPSTLRVERLHGNLTVQAERLAGFIPGPGAAAKAETPPGMFRVQKDGKLVPVK